MAYDPHASRLNWSYSEKEQVIRRAVQLRRETSTMTSMHALFAAQDVLPDVRRKKRFTHYFQNALLNALAESEEKMRRNPELIPEPAPIETFSAAEPEPLAEEPALETPEPKYEPLEIPAPAPTMPTLAEMCREIGSALGAAFAREFGPVLIHAMKETMIEQIAKAAEQQGVMPEALIDFGDKEYIAGTKHRKRVAVVGLLGSQRSTIEESFPNIDFRWIDNGANGSTVKTVAHTCDEVFLMTKFISHRTQDACPRSKRVMINGGVTDLSRVLATRYANGNGQH